MEWSGSLIHDIVRSLQSGGVRIVQIFKTNNNHAYSSDNNGRVTTNACH